MTMNLVRDVLGTALFVIAVCALGCQRAATGPGSTSSSSNSVENYEPDLTGIVTASQADSPQQAKAKHDKLAAHLQRAREHAGRGEQDEAIRLLEEAVLLDSRHRAVLLLLVECLQTRSNAVATEDPARGYRLMVKAGGYLRMLRDAHPDLTAEERRVVANVLFDEARAHARANRREETAGSLRAAIDAGFSELERLETEPDFQELRKDPALSKMFAEAARTVESRGPAR